MRPWLVAALLVLLIPQWGCELGPGLYSAKKSGRIVDVSGKPIPGARIFTRVYRRCGGFGGYPKSETITTTSVASDSVGRYTRDIQNKYWSLNMVVYGCWIGTKDVACKTGLGCVGVDEQGNASIPVRYDGDGHEASRPEDLIPPMWNDSQ